MRKSPAALLATTAVAAAQLAGGRHGPTPDHPRTAAWYAALRKPSFTPPGPVFAVAWTGLDLPREYPMVAPSYAAKRSRLAKRLGLGRKPGAAPASEPELEPEVKNIPARRARGTKA